jgi:hypothetical protein
MSGCGSFTFCGKEKEKENEIVTTKNCYIVNINLLKHEIKSNIENP